MKALSLMAALAVVLILVPESADAQAAGRKKVRGAKTEEGAAAVGGSKRAAGQNGALSGRRRGAKDGEGNAAAGRRGCATGANAAGCAGAGTAVDAEGNVSRKAGGALTTENGEASRQGTFNRNADGTFAGERSSEASGQRGSVTGNTTVDSETGVTRDKTATKDDSSVTVQSSGKAGEGASRSVTCKDAAGNTIDCPKK
ncbi:MAG: hypothetical protein ACFB6R_16620 [Alphaproteobacteria bacterium]